MKNIVKITISLRDAKRYVCKNPILKTQRFVDDLEILVVAGISKLFDAARVAYPLRGTEISLYLLLDQGIEEIKNKFLSSILKEGVDVASPLLFPYTAPNTITARATILFGIHGESITFPVKNSPINVLKYTSIFLYTNHSKVILGYTNTDKEKREDYTITLAYIVGKHNLLEIEKTISSLLG